jgi:hypothetical protein
MPTLSTSPANPASVDDEIASASEHEQRQPARAGKLGGFQHIGFIPGFGEITRWSADTEGRQGSKRNILADQHGDEDTINVVER